MEAGEDADGEVTVGEAVADLEVGARVLHADGTDVETLLLDVLAEVRYPGGKEHGRLVRDVATNIVVGLVV